MGRPEEELTRTTPSFEGDRVETPSQVLGQEIALLAPARWAWSERAPCSRYRAQQDLKGWVGPERVDDPLVDDHLFGLPHRESKGCALEANLTACRGHGKGREESWV